MFDINTTIMMRNFLGNLYFGNDIISLVMSFAICLVATVFLSVGMRAFIEMGKCVISIFPRPNLTEQQAEKIGQAVFEQLLFFILLVIVWFEGSGILAIVLSFIAFLWASYVVNKERKEK